LRREFPTSYLDGKRAPTYVSWWHMIARCSDINYPYYKGRGVSVCDRWGDFSNFLADMGTRPEGTTLGRILDRGNYEPGNVFWMTRTEQGLNQRNNNSLRRWEMSRAKD